MISTICNSNKNIPIKARDDITVPVDFLRLAAGVGPTKTDTTMPDKTKEVNTTMLGRIKNVDAGVIIARQDTIMINIPMLTRIKKVNTRMISDAAGVEVNPIAPIVHKLVDDSIDSVMHKLVDDSIDPVIYKLIDDSELGQDNLSKGK